MIKNSKPYVISMAFLSIFISFSSIAQTFADGEVYPGEDWLQYADLSAAGWEREKIERAFAFADSLNSAAFLLVEDGVVVSTYGDVSRRYMCHSVRKSLLSALYGIYEEKGKIDINKTIAELGIDDQNALSEQEKQAKISDLLKARSGVYHPAAYETPQMAAARPARGSHAPNTNWYYNNWDFNTLGYIFRQESGEDVFEAFGEQLARPLGMEDYKPWHGYYHLEPRHSNFPAYPFRMSARDLARLGLLFERNGQWNGKQIIPEEWISESVTSYSDIQHSVSKGYGYMWWVLDDSFEPYGGGYTALGVGGQTITVLPQQDIVFVHRTDTYTPIRIPSTRVMDLLKMLLKAKSGTDNRQQMELVVLEENESENGYKLQDKLLQEYSGNYRFKSGYAVEVSLKDGNLRLSDPQFGNFNLIPLSDTGFMLEDAMKPVYFVDTGDSIMFISEHIINADGYHLLRSGKTAEAVNTLRLNTKYYPDSFNAFDSMGEACLRAGDTANAVDSYKESLRLNPYNIQAMWILLQAGVEGFAEITLPREKLAPLSGTYNFQNQEIIMLAEKDTLYLMTPQGQRVMRMIPVSAKAFIMDGGSHYKFVFNEVDGRVTDFDLITRNGIAGKGIKTD